MVFGGTITLSHDVITLTLDECDFFCSDSDPLGYVRKKSDLITPPSVEILPFGAVKIRQNPQTILQDIRMELLLSNEKAYTLKAIIEDSALAIAQQLPNSWIEIEDSRSPTIEKDPRTRAKVGAIITTNPTPPAGHTLYYPKGAYTLTSPELESGFWGNSQIEKIRCTVTGTELFILDTSNDA